MAGAQRSFTMKSLRARLMMLVSGAMVMLALLQSVVIFFTTLHEADELFDYHLEQMAFSLREGRFDTVTANLRRQPVGEDEFEFAIRVTSPRGERTYETGIHPAFPADSPAGFSTVGLGSTAWRLYAIRSDEGTIEVGQSLSIRRNLARDFALSSVAPVLVIVPLLLLFVGWAVRRAISPLDAVTKELERRTEQRLDPIPMDQVLPEMVPVVRSMNGLLSRIRAAFDHQRAFIADAAHELRSPLAALKLQAQILGRTHEVGERALAQARLEAGVDRSVHLAEQLLALARVEAQAAEASAPSIDLRQAVKLALVDVTAHAEARAVDVGLTDTNDNVPVVADLDSLHLLARNLLENAIRHAPVGTRVDASVTLVGDHAELCIDDAGPGIAPQDRDHVFDRFYRGANASPGGSGLGLAIVNTIAQRYRAGVHLESSPLGGLRVRVTFLAAAR